MKSTSNYSKLTKVLAMVLALTLTLGFATLESDDLNQSEHGSVIEPLGNAADNEPPVVCECADCADCNTSSDSDKCAWCDEINCDDSCKICQNCNDDTCDWLACRHIGDNGSDINENLITATSSPTDIITDAFTDPIFLAYVRSLPQVNKPTGDILVSDVSGISFIQIIGQGISSLAGIEYFTSLTLLRLMDTELTSLDLSNNTLLTELELSNCQLTSLNLSNNTALTSLHLGSNPALSSLSFNQLTSLNLSNNTELTNLRLDYNQLTSLDLSNNTKLTHLGLGYNRLTSLDLSNNTSLETLDVSHNQLTLIDLSNNTKLIYLGLGDNRLTSLDLSNNTELTGLYLNNNHLTSLEALNISNKNAITSLYLSGNQLTAVDLSQYTALDLLTLYRNQLTSIDVSKNTALVWLGLSGNLLTSIDVSNNKNLTNLLISNNYLQSMDSIIGLANTKVDISNSFFFEFDPQKKLSDSAVVADSVSAGVDAALSNNGALVLTGANTNITVSDLQKIKASGGVLDIQLPNGVHISIPAASIGNSPVPIDLNIVLTSTTTSTTVNGAQVPANSLIINPTAHGEFGFTVQIHIPVSALAAAGLGSGNLNLFYVRADGTVVNYGAIQRLSDGSAIVSISHASQYYLSSPPQVLSGRSPQTGDERTLILPLLMIVFGFIGIGSWVLYNKRIKNAKTVQQ